MELKDIFVVINSFKMCLSNRCSKVSLPYEKIMIVRTNRADVMLADVVEQMR